MTGTQEVKYTCICGEEVVVRYEVVVEHVNRYGLHLGVAKEVDDNGRDAWAQHELGHLGQLASFTCPRRAENGMDRADSPFRFSGENLDVWDDGRCSYCGSISGDEFVRRLMSGEEAQFASGKRHKIYLSDRQKFYVAHLSPEHLSSLPPGAAT